jgi:hypothetical protein
VVTVKPATATPATLGARDYSNAPGADVLPEDIPPMFVEILRELIKERKVLGGVRNFNSGRPQIERKIKRNEFQEAYTDYEYIYLTVLGFAQLHMHCEEIISKNNGRAFNQNPGVQLLESFTGAIALCCDLGGTYGRCLYQPGMTMHGDRDGANGLLRTAAASLVEAFQLAKSSKRDPMKEFFRNAFDRTADPCLEGRVGRIMEFLELRQGRGKEDAAPWADVSLQPLARSATSKDLVGEHLRVFVNECTWQWSKEKGISYDLAKQLRQQDEEAKDFARLYNADSFKTALLSRNVVKTGGKVWEVQGNNTWTAFDEAGNQAMETARSRGLGKTEVRIRNFTYDIDFERMVQRNKKTNTERAIRQVESSSPSPGKVSLDDLDGCIKYFVELATLPASATNVSRGPSGQTF